MKRIAVFLFAILLLFSGCGKPSVESTALEQEAPVIILLSEHNGGVQCLNDEVITTYWNMDFSESLDYLKEHCYKATYEMHDGQVLQMRWEGGTAPYELSYGTGPDLTDAKTIVTERDRFSPGTLYPNTTYYWQVRDAEGNMSETGSFVTDDAPRFIRARERLDARGVRNVRDLGGYRAMDGKTTRYDMLFRGGLLLYPNSEKTYVSERINDYGKEVLQGLGIRTEIDLRDASDYGGQEEPALDNCAYIRVTCKGYTSIFPESAYPESVFSDSRTFETYHTIFSLLADEANYPVYFHCLAGQDRTGTLAYLILGLLGVDYQDITKDYELSAFSSLGTMNREKDWNYSGDGVPAGTHHEEAVWQKLNEVMLSAYGTESGLLCDAVANYLMTECAVTNEQIESIRSLLLVP